MKIKNAKFIEAKNIETTKNGLSFRIQNTEFKIPIMGEFNIYNALAAICVGLSQGISLETCKRVLEKTKGIPGRMEIIVQQPFKVIVDYAHTPEQLKNVYETLSNQKPKTKNQKLKLICVLGSCGGGRDKWKRPELGKIAAKYCDQIIITNEDPYDENPLSIIEEIESGFSQIPNSKHQIPNKSQIPALPAGRPNPKFQNVKYEKVIDRKEAIKKALKSAKPGDTVIITGKGSEPWMCLENGRKIPWDDRTIVREELEKYHLPP